MKTYNTGMPKYTKDSRLFSLFMQQDRRGKCATGVNDVQMAYMTQDGARKKPLRSSEITARAIGCSGRIVERCRTIIDRGSPDVLQALQVGHLSINSAYNITTGKERENPKISLHDIFIETITNLTLGQTSMRALSEDECFLIGSLAWRLMNTCYLSIQDYRDVLHQLISEYPSLAEKFHKIFGVYLIGNWNEPELDSNRIQERSNIFRVKRVTSKKVVSADGEYPVNRRDQKTGETVPVLHEKTKKTQTHHPIPVIPVTTGFNEIGISTQACSSVHAVIDEDGYINRDDFEQLLSESIEDHEFVSENAGYDFTDIDDSDFPDGENDLDGDTEEDTEPDDGAAFTTDTESTEECEIEDSDFLDEEDETREFLELMSNPTAKVDDSDFEWQTPEDSWNDISHEIL